MSMHEMAIFLPIGSDGRMSAAAIERYGVRNWDGLAYALKDPELNKKIRKIQLVLQNWSEQISTGNISLTQKQKIHFLVRKNQRIARKWITARAEKAAFFHAIRWNLFQVEVARFFDQERSENLLHVFRLEWKIEHLWRFIRARSLVWKELDVLRHEIQDLAYRVRSHQEVFTQVSGYGYVRECVRQFASSSSKKWKDLSCGRNAVYWHPGSRCVFKIARARLEYEESLVESLSHFYGGVIPVSVRVFRKNQWKARARPYFHLESLQSLKMRGVVKKIFSQLSVEGEMAAIFSAEMQFLHLSERNVHFTKCKTKDELLMVLLDTELSVAESNDSLYAVDQYQKKTIFPFRSCLLGLSWARQTLSQECLKWLNTLPAGDGPLWDWVNRKKETFLARASPNGQQTIFHKLTPLLEKYSFSNYCARTGGWSFAKIRWCFVRDLANMQENAHKAFWELIQEQFPALQEKVQVARFETLAYLAKKYSVSLTLLQKANPQYSVNEALPEEGWISIPIHLTDSSPLAKKKRRRWAKQLFPRMTLWQQQALRERQQRRSAYLRLYQELEGSTISCKKDLFKYVQSPFLPFPTQMRREWVQTLTRLGSEDIFSLESLRNLLIELMRPSYYNLCLAMYPLLGDVIRIYQVVYPIGGIDLIGSFEHSLESTLALAKQLPDPDIRDLAAHVAKKTLGRENRVYFSS